MSGPAAESEIVRRAIDQQTADRNPYAPPQMPRKESKRPKRVPTSLRQAIWFGILRGARFGGKIMGLLLSGILFLLFLAMFAAYVLVWYVRGHEAANTIWTGHSWLWFVGNCIGGMAVTVAWASIIGAVIMGIGAAVEYCRRKKSPSEDQSMASV